MTSKTSLKRPNKNATTRRATRRSRSGCDILKSLYLAGQIKTGQTKALDAYLKFLCAIRPGRYKGSEDVELNPNTFAILKNIGYHDTANHRIAMYRTDGDDRNIVGLIERGLVEVHVGSKGYGLTCTHVSIDIVNRTARVVT